MGRPVDDLEVQVLWGALYGGLLGALRHWHATDYAEPLGDLLNETLTILSRGLDVEMR